MLEPRAASAPVAPPPSPRPAARTLLRAALGVVPWLLLGAACLDENSASDDSSSEGGGVGQNSVTTAGTGGLSPIGMGGSAATTPVTPAGGSGGSAPATSSGGMSSIGGGQAAAGGNSAGPGPLPAEPGETGVFVGMTAAHNAARAELNLNPPLPELTWSQELADFAQEWADNLASDTNCGKIFHRDQRMYGENIAFRGSSRLTVEYTPEEAVESWVAEVACWEYGTILGNRAPSAGSESCDPVCIAGQHSSGCGHYTQVIWRNTRQVGCGYAQCGASGFTDEVWVCNYNPPGNFVGQTPY